MSLVYKKVFRSASAIMGILNRVLQEGLDLVGVRLLYPTQELLHAANPGAVSMEIDEGNILTNIGPVLALALRGVYARVIWLDAVGPSDPSLARRTDPRSLCALYGGESREECLLFSPRHPSRIQTELCRWFGGRVPASGVIDVGKPDRTRSSSGDKRGKKTACADEFDTPRGRPPAALVCSVKSDVIVALSPLVPVKALGLLLATCQRRGYQLFGVKRLMLSAKQATCLGESLHHDIAWDSHDSLYFTPVPGLCAKESSIFVEDDGGRHAAAGIVADNLPLRPSTLLLLQRENALHGAASLVEAFMVQLSLKNLLGEHPTPHGWLCS